MENDMERHSSGFRADFALPLLAVILSALSLVPTPFATAAVKASATSATHSQVPPAEPFSLETVIGKAKELAAQPYDAQDGKVPKALLDLTYDQWRDIRFKTEKSLWRSEHLPFEVQFFPPGFCYDRTVKVNIVDGKGVIPFDPSREIFTYGRVISPLVSKEGFPEKTGVAGFRFHAPILTKTYYDEFLVFLGASYLRAVAKGQHYGVSARGLAVDTATAQGEKFPRFREFWLVKPRPGDKSVTLYALLDSPGLTGAYRYTATPGKETVIDVRSVLFLRHNVEKLGIAPMTGMFFFGENSSGCHEDYRPEVHDSDGLLIHFQTDEWLWRPLDNPKELLVSSFQAPNVQGFGLLQRGRDFTSYQDLESHFQDRPSVWIEPTNDWGEGRVELVEIPTDKEINDNIVAYWVPDKQFPPGSPMRYDYKMHWFNPTMDHSPPGYVTATRISGGKDASHKIFIVDWDGKTLRQIPESTKLEAVVTVGAGATLVEQQVYPNPITGGWRLSCQLAIDNESTLGKILPDKRQPIELRAFLKNGGDALTETWSYVYQP
jgi:glucans biosynthesis protein